MKRVRLCYENMQQMAGVEGLAVIVLTDEARQRALTVVCDELSMHQIMLRLQHVEVCQTLLPEVLLQMMPDVDHEMMVFGLHDGQYQVILSDVDFQNTVRLRMSDAVLLSVIAPDIPLYIEEGIFSVQSVPFEENAKGIAIPINTMDRHYLGELLQRAIREENYELASKVRDELKFRETVRHPSNNESSTTTT